MVQKRSKLFLLLVLSSITLRAQVTVRDTVPLTTRWEIRATILPIPMRSFQVRDPFATTPGGPASPFEFQDYLLNDGSVIRLAQQPVAEGRRQELFGRFRFQLPASSIEVVKHLPKGSRYSIGFAYFREDDPLFTEYPELNALVDASNFISISGRQARTLYTFVGLQYTARRRKRMRYHFGFTFLILLTQRVTTETVLYGGATPEIHPVSFTDTRNNRFFRSFLPIPQLTAEYLLSDKWSISFGAGGSTGLGLGYRP